MRSIASRASRAAAGMYPALLERVQRSWFPRERAGWRATSPGAAVPDALLDPVARGGLADGRDRAAVQVGRDQVQALPPTVPVEQGPGLVEDPVVFDRLGHGCVSPGPGGTPDHRGAGAGAPGNDRYL